MRSELSNFEDVETYYVQEYFPSILARENTWFQFTSIFLSAMLIGKLFSRRTLETFRFQGRSRIRIAIEMLIWFYCICFLLSGLRVLGVTYLLVKSYGLHVIPQLPVHAMVPIWLLGGISLCAVSAIPILIIFWSHDPFLTPLLSLGSLFALSFLPYNGRPLWEFTSNGMWQPEIDRQMLSQGVSVSLIYILVGSIFAVWIFCCRDIYPDK